jgi:hypothetical protein
MPFDYKKFSAECDVMSEVTLQKEWENYTRQIAGSATSTAISISAAPFTLGISFIGLGFSCPRIHNARKKRHIIQTHLEALDLTHHTRKRDVCGSMALSSAIGAATLGFAAPGADAVAAIGAEHAIMAIEESYTLIKVASHVVLDGIGEAVDEVYAKTMQSKASKKTM